MFELGLLGKLGKRQLGQVEPYMQRNVDLRQQVAQYNWGGEIRTNIY